MFSRDNKINENSLISLLFIAVSTSPARVRCTYDDNIMLNNYAAVDSYSIINQIKTLTHTLGRTTKSIQLTTCTVQTN